MNHPGRRPPPRLDRRASELLLRRDPSARRLAPDLAEVLEAAAAPGRPDELSGGLAALAAFRAARQNPSRPPYKIPLRTGLTRLLTLKAAVVLAAATGGVTVTLAAATGSLPGSPVSPASNPPGASAPQTSSPAGNPLTDSPRLARPTTRATSASPDPTCPDTPRPTGDTTPQPTGDMQPQQQQPQGGPNQPPAPEPNPQRDTQPGGCGDETAGPTGQPPPSPSFGGTPTYRQPGGDCRDRCPLKTGGPTFGG
jgi:hypothetical protein